MPQLPRDPRRWPSERNRRLRFAGSAIGVVIAMVLLVAALRPHRPMSRGEDFSAVNRLSGGLAEWTAPYPTACACVVLTHAPIRVVGQCLFRRRSAG
jgi:hypothetical protein